MGYKIIGGIKYLCKGTKLTKAEADSWVKKSRSLGYRVRALSTENGYSIYSAGKA